MHIIRTLLSSLTSTTLTYVKAIIAPPRCSYCSLLLTADTVFCIPCTQKITPIVTSHITLSSRYHMTIYAVSNYREPLKSLILAKNRSDHIASRQLGQLIWERTIIKHAAIDYFIPIPLHWTRFAYRGFNQADEIAHILSQHTGKPILHALKRSKKTVFQASLTHDKRMHNVQHAFTLAIDPSLLHNKHIILVDDLMTTSATLRSVAKMLMPYKPASINAVVACRVV